MSNTLTDADRRRPRRLDLDRHRRARRRAVDDLGGGAAGSGPGRPPRWCPPCAIAVSIPVLVIVWSIVQPSTEVWEELWATRLPGMIRDTATLLVGGAVRHAGARHVARLAGDRLPVPRAAPARLVAGDAARDPRLRARLRLARHVPGTARRPRRAIDLAVRAGAHDHPVSVRLPVREGGVPRAVAAGDRRGAQPRVQPIAGVLARRAADGAAVARGRRRAGRDGGADRRRHRAVVQRVDHRRRRAAGLVRHRQPQRCGRARRAADRHRDRADRDGTSRPGTGSVHPVGLAGRPARRAPAWHPGGGSLDDRLDDVHARRRTPRLPADHLGNRGPPHRPDRHGRRRPRLPSDVVAAGGGVATVSCLALGAAAGRRIEPAPSRWVAPRSDGDARLHGARPRRRDRGAGHPRGDRPDGLAARTVGCSSGRSSD